MRYDKLGGLACVTAALVVFGSLTRAQDAAPAVPVTVITVPNMHCMGCAKKMAAALYKVPGVDQVLADVEKTTLTTRPKVGAVLSPRALWEAVEKAGYQPTRLQGPSGTFTSKPKF